MPKSPDVISAADGANACYYCSHSHRSLRLTCLYIDPSSKIELVRYLDMSVDGHQITYPTSSDHISVMQWTAGQEERSVVCAQNCKRVTVTPLFVWSAPSTEKHPSRKGLMAITHAKLFYIATLLSPKL